MAQKDSDDGPVTFEGYGAVFNNTDSDGDTFVEGAFAKSLKQRVPAMLSEHRMGVVPGKFVDLAEDETGLKVKGELTPGHSLASDIGASLKHGAVTGLSVGFITRAYEPKGEDKRGIIIKEADLFEISIVSMPANDKARIADVKSAIDAITDFKSAENFMREACGFSHSTAVGFIGRLRGLLGEQADSGQAKGATLGDLESVMASINWDN